MNTDKKKQKFRKDRLPEDELCFHSSVVFHFPSLIRVHPCEFVVPFFSLYFRVSVTVHLCAETGEDCQSSFFCALASFAYGADA
jgi:hypothetical protein